MGGFFVFYQHFDFSLILFHFIKDIIYQLTVPG